MTTQDFLRDKIVEILVASRTLANKDVYSPGDWPTQTETMPIIHVDDPHEEKMSEGRHQPSFTVTGYFRVDARLKATTEKECRISLDILRNQIQRAVIGNYDLQRLIQQVKHVKTVKQINSESGFHVGQVVIEFGLEYYQGPEDFDTLAPGAFIASDTPAPAVIEDIEINVDLRNVFDATNNYAPTVFPPVPAAPRTTGPDGRNEGFIKINPDA